MQAAVATGTIRLDVARLGDLMTRATSASHSIAGLNWYIEAELYTHSRSGQRWGRRRGQRADLDFFIYCNSERTGWSCQADVNFTLLSQSGERLDSAFNALEFSTEDFFATCQAFNDILNPKYSPLFHEDGVIIEVAVTITKVYGVQDVSTVPRKISTCDFSIPQPDIADVALVIGEKRLYVSKQLLAVHSPVFRAMFFSEFVEKDKKEIPIEDLDFDEFVEFLHVIYPSRKPVTAATIDCLLTLGDRFNSEVVLRECEAFLCGSAGTELPLEKRLLYADRFSLSRLQVYFLDSITTADEAKAVRETREFGDFSDKMKLALLDKFYMLS